MKMKVKAEELMSALKSASELLKEKKSNPIFGYFLFRAEDDILNITTSHDDGASVTLPIKAEKDLLETCSFCVPQKIKEVVSLIDGDIDLDYDASSQKLTISYKSGNTELGCISADGYAVKEFKAESGQFTQMEMKSEFLKEGISFCAPFVSNSPIRPVMCSIHMKAGDSGLVFVGTDAVNLAKYSCEEKYPEFCCNLVGKYAQMLVNFIGDSDTVNVIFNENAIQFSSKDFSFSFPIVVGNYPNYERILPKEEDIKASTTLNKAEILHSATMVGICTSKTTKLVKMAVSGESMTLYGEDIDNGSKASGYSSCQSAEFKIGLNIDNLTTALRSLSTDSVNISFIEGNRPLRISPIGDDKRMILLMPTNI